MTVTAMALMPAMVVSAVTNLSAYPLLIPAVSLCLIAVLHPKWFRIAVTNSQYRNHLLTKMLVLNVPLVIFGNQDTQDSAAAMILVALFVMLPYVLITMSNKINTEIQAYLCTQQKL